MQEAWFKNAVVYALDVEWFKDSDDDGVGDFEGLTRQLDYLQWLGIECLWVLPFYPTPNRDNGYDLTDYYAIDPRLGTFGRFAEFLHEAHSRGIRVIVDLIANHTSDQHPWFQSVRQAKDSPYRRYYVWTDDPSREPDYKNIFPTVEKDVWTYDEQAGAYYLHHFYSHEPDLDTADPEVRAELRRVAGFWLQLQVDGLRVDAAPYLTVTRERDQELDPHPFLRELRQFVSGRRSQAVLVAEADVDADELGDYFGGNQGDEMHLLFNFLLSEHTFLTFARERAEPIARVLGMLPDRPPTAQWLNFLRNLDELDIERLSQDEQQEVYAVFAPKEEMRAYGRGVRRRLAPMLAGDRRRVELAWSLLFSLPGVPMVVYGDEIGMGDDLELRERNAVRTPMQWSSDRNGGFSSAPSDKLVHSVIASGPYGFKHVNVEDQREDPGSLLNWMRRLIQVRRWCPEIGLGAYRVLDVGLPSVLAHSCEWGEKRLVGLHNLSSEPAEVKLETLGAEPLEVIFGAAGGEQSERIVRLEGYGYSWLRGH